MKHEDGFTCFSNNTAKGLIVTDQVWTDGVGFHGGVCLSVQLRLSVTPRPKGQTKRVAFTLKDPWLERPSTAWLGLHCNWIAQIIGSIFPLQFSTSLVKRCELEKQCSKNSSDSSKHVWIQSFKGRRNKQIDYVYERHGLQFVDLGPKCWTELDEGRQVTKACCNWWLLLHSSSCCCCCSPAPLMAQNQRQTLHGLMSTKKRGSCAWMAGSFHSAVCGRV